MIRSEANNTFGEGLMMDMNPLTTHNTVMTNCLNGTLVTFNGNEYILQNDMGNGRVQTAYLPEGFVPLGTTQFGGIIYIVSYNPLDNRCQIGSFPSPERNTFTTNDTKAIVTLSNTDFNYATAADGAKIQYLKKSLGNRIYNPGDKFIVYSTNLQENFDNIFGLGGKPNVKLSIGLVSSDGKLTILDQLKTFDITKQSSSKNKALFETTDVTEDTTTDNTDTSSDQGGTESTISQTTTKLDGTNLTLDKEVDLRPLTPELSNSVTANPITSKSAGNTEHQSIPGPGPKDFEIYECNGVDVNSSVDNLRTLTTQPYNILKGSSSGELVIIAELVQFNSFDVEVSHIFNTAENGRKQYNPAVTFKFDGDYDYTPYAVRCKLTLEGEDISAPIEESYDIELTTITNSNDYKKSVDIDNILDKFNEIKSKVQGINFGTRTGRKNQILHYKFIPCMKWGEVTHLTVKNKINLANLNSGIIELNNWRYYNTEEFCNLTWGLDVYNEEDKKVQDVAFKLVEIHNISNSLTFNLDLDIDKRDQYNGIFHEIIPFNIESGDVLEGSNIVKLNKDSLYLVQITVKYGSSANDSENRLFYRWLYTNSYFNTYYKNYADYDELTLELETDIDVKYTSDNSPDSKYHYGTILKRIDKPEDYQTAEKDVICAKQTVGNNVFNCNAKLILKNNYNTFRVVHSGIVDPQYPEELSVEIGSPTVNVTSNSVYVNKEDDKYQEYLKNIILTNWDGSTPSLDDLNTDTVNNYGNSVRVTNQRAGANYNLTIGGYPVRIEYKTLQLTKAYYTRQYKEYNYTGTLKPLCYDSATFAKYNLKYNNGKFVPTILGSFYFDSGTYGGITPKIGCKKSDSNWRFSNKSTSTSGNSLNFNRDSNLPITCKSAGWVNSIMFATYYGGENNTAYLKWREGTDKSDTWSFNKNNDNNKFATNGAAWTDNQYYQLVIVMMKSQNSDSYLPLNFCVRDNTSNGPLNFFDNSLYNTFYHHFAQILNNIYKYETVEKGTKQGYSIPDLVFYQKDYKYTATIPAIFRVNNTNHYEIYIKDTRLDSVKTILTTIKHKFPNISVTCNNLTATIKNPSSKKVNLVYENSNSDSLDLRDHIISQAVSTLETLVYDFDGVTPIGWQHEVYNSALLYCRESEYSSPGNNPIIYKNVKEACNFRPIRINYSANSEGVKVQNTTDYQFLYDTGNDTGNDQNLSNDYMLSDGVLVLRGSPDTRTFKLAKFSDNNENEIGNISGFQIEGFNKEYQAWK